jgi:hypothetical protein
MKRQGKKSLMEEKEQIIGKVEEIRSLVREESREERRGKLDGGMGV